MIVIAGFALALGVAYSAQGQSLTSIIDLLDGTRDFQLRVEQRVIVRFPNQPVTVSSGRGDNRKSVIYNEEKIGRCLLLDRLIASRPGPKNTLELVTRDRQLVRA